MSVMEHTGEIGTIMALGSRRLTVMRQFLLEGCLLGVIGGVLGVVLAWILSEAISAVGIPMPPPPGADTGYLGEIRFTARLALEGLALAVGTTLAASVYPAWKASRMGIADALRFNR